MAIIKTSNVLVQQFASALYGIQLGSTTMNAVLADATRLSADGSNGLDRAFNAYYANSFGGMTNAAVANTVVANLGITGAAATEAAAYIANQLAAATPTTKGAVINNVLNVFSNATADATYGAAATAWNTKVTNAVAYSASNTADVAAGTAVAANFTLTTGMDTLTGTGKETVAGLQNAGGVAGGQNYQSGDSITNVKNVNLMVTANDAGAAVVTLKDVENVTANSFVANTLNAAAFTNVANINATGGQGAGSVLTINNGSIGTTYSVADTSASGITVNVRAGEVLGTADTIKFAANTAGSTTTGAAGTAPVVATATFTSNTTGIETVSVATTGTNVFNVVSNNTALTDATKLVITGAGNNTIGTAGMTNVATYDMSGATGNNTLNVAGTLTTGDSVIGGTGTDTLRMNNASTIANIKVTDVETLRLSTGSATGTAIFAGGPSFTTVRVDGDAAEAGTQTLTNVGAVSKVQYKADGLSASAGTAQQFNNLTIANSFTGSADTVAVTVDNSGVTNAAGYTLRTLTTHGVETMSVAISDLASTATATFTGITDNTLSSLTVSSTGVVALGTVNAVNAAGTAGMLTSLDASAISGATASSVTLAANTLGSVAVINATGTGGFTTVINATQTGNTQIIYTGGAGVDTFNAAASAFGGTLVIDGKGGADNITGGGVADVITGGEGADTIRGAGGDDSIILTETVSAIDTVVFEATAATNGTDTITGFTAGTDRLNVAAFETVGALVALDPAAGGLTTTAGTVYYLGGQAAGAADSAAGAATAITAGATWTAANATAWVVISDNNSSAIYSWTDVAGTAGATAAELTLVATIDAAITTAQLATTIII